MAAQAGDQTSADVASKLLEAILATIHQAPCALGIARSRWTLALLQQHCPALGHLRTLPGVWRSLHRLRIHWRRGRLSVSSPDPLYEQKMAVIQKAYQRALADPEHERLLYADETSCYRQPLVRCAWHPAGAGGRRQKRVRCANAANVAYRFIGTLDAITGRVLSRGNGRISVERIAGFLKYVRRSYGPDIRLSVVWDNWPIHYYDNVIKAAQEANITLLYLPTYAPWTNPIERLWLRLKEEMLAMHTESERWPQLKERLCAYLGSYDRDAPDLLKAVGLARVPS